jgi:hypothetical protein
MKRCTLTGSQFLSRFAGETQSSQLLSAVANPLLRCVIICGRLWSTGFSTLARLEDPLSAGTICVFMLGYTHKHRRRGKFQLAGRKVLRTKGGDLIGGLEERSCLEASWRNAIGSPPPFPEPIG